MHIPLYLMKLSSELSIVHGVPSRNLIDSILPTSSSVKVMFELLEVVALFKDNDECIGVQNTIHRRELNHETVFHLVPLDFEFNSSQFK